MKKTALVLGLCSSIAAGACSSASPPVTAPKPNASAKATSQAGTEPSFGLPAVVPKLRFMPDLDASRGVLLKSEEGELSLIGRMRLRTTAEGVTDRADELLPQGRIVAQRLPSRLGSGYVFLAVTGRGSELWRSQTWLGRLEPLASFGPVAHSERPLTMGFDRLYLRFATQNELVALDPKTGAVMPYGPLPVAPGYGEMLFVDGWRAVVDTDISGTLATFDAGATWRRLSVSGRVRGIVPSSADPDDGDEAIVQVENGTYRLTRSGHVTFSGNPAPTSPQAPADPSEAKKAPRPGPLGKKPLRVAIERGYPDSATTAVVASSGDLVRVSLETGAVLDVAEHAYPDEHAECTGIALASSGTKPEDSFGFVCGSSLGSTAVFAFERPLRLREVMRFSKPRVVTESGQGAIVVRGACSDEESAGARPFCVRFADGTTREVRVRGEVGAERVIALADGRVVILVPPRVGTQGQISILEGKSSKHIVLKMPEAGAPRELETGMWLEGFHQVDKDAIAGWVEAGGPTFGVRIALDGAVTIGDIVDEQGGILMGGRFGIAIGDTGHMLETTDTGMTWRELELPRVDGASDQLRSRRCGPAGCVLPGWIKIGWGDLAREEDFAEAAAPAAIKLSSLKLSSGPLSFSCKSGRSEPKPKKPSKKNEGSSITGWVPLRDVEAPPMQKGEVGVDNGAPFDVVPVRSYIWGKKESDWTRTGKLVVRWSDRFSLEEIQSSATTTSPWASEALASEAFGVGTYGYSVNWSAQRDRDAALVSACRGRVCSTFAVEPEEPVLTLRTTETGGLVKPFAGSATRLGQVWFYLGDGGFPEQVPLYRADLGHVRLVTSFRRLMSPRFAAAPLPRLVRRAKSDTLGLTFVLREGPTDKRGVRYVLPIDPDSGDVGEPIRIGRPDFADVEFSASCGDRDGWVLELPMEPSPNIELDGMSASMESVELRLRVEEGRACIEAGVASVFSSFSEDKKAKGAKGEGKTGAGFSIMAADRSAGTRRELLCEMKPKLPLP